MKARSVKSDLLQHYENNFWHRGCTYSFLYASSDPSKAKYERICLMTLNGDYRNGYENAEIYSYTGWVPRKIFSHDPPPSPLPHTHHHRNYQFFIEVKNLNIKGGANKKKKSPHFEVRKNIKKYQNPTDKLNSIKNDLQYGKAFFMEFNLPVRF